MIDNNVHYTCTFNSSCSLYINVQYHSIWFVSGFVGHHCGINVDECESDPCLHGSECIDLVNAYKCDCADGWEGHHCQNNIMCVENPCENGGLHSLTLLMSYSTFSSSTGVFVLISTVIFK